MSPNGPARKASEGPELTGDRAKLFRMARALQAAGAAMQEMAQAVLVDLNGPRAPDPDDPVQRMTFKNRKEPGNGE